jgi:signal transduction histidine kinase
MGHNVTGSDGADAHAGEDRYPSGHWTDSALPSEVALDLSIEITELLTPTTMLTSLLQLATELVWTRCQLEAASLYFVDPTQDAVQARAHAGKGRPHFADNGAWVSIDQASILAHAIRERRGLAETAAPHRAHSLLHRDPPAPELSIAVPLEIQDRVVGLLHLRSRRSTDGEPDTLRALYAVGRHLAAVIHHAQHSEREQHQRQLIENLNVIARTLTQTLDPERVLEMILMHLETIVPYDRGAIMLQEGSELIMRAIRGFPSYASPLRIRVPIRADDVYQTIFRTRQPLVIADIAQRLDWQHVDGLPPAQSWLGVPLVVENEVIGMLSLARERSDPYTDEQVALSLSFAQQASVALNNARLYDSLSHVNATLEQTVDQLRKQSYDLQVTYEQLKRLDQAKTDFITVASHELRTPLTVLSGYGQMLAGDPELASDAFRGQVIRGLLAGAERLNTIVDNMLDMARIDNQTLEVHPEPMFPSVLIKAIYPTLKSVLQDRRITMNLERSLSGLPLIEADTAGIRKIFRHLMVNAIKYTPDGGSIRIWGRTLGANDTTLGQDAVEIVISDTGIGIDPVVKELIFAKFYQTGQVAIHSSGDAKFKGGGPGLGLAIARGIVEAHGGRIWAESPGYDEVRCPGSDFHVVLPLVPGKVLAAGR